MVLSVDHNLRDRAVLHEYLQDVQPAEGIEQLLLQPSAQFHRPGHQPLLQNDLVYGILHLGVREILHKSWKNTNM